MRCVGRAGVVVGLHRVGGRSAFGGFLWWVVSELEARGGVREVRVYVRTGSPCYMGWRMRWLFWKGCG